MKKTAWIIISLALEDFRKKFAEEFAEWEMVYEGKYYGTLKSELHRIWQIKGLRCWMLT